MESDLSGEVKRGRKLFQGGAFGFYFGSIVGSAESARRFTAFQAESYQSRFPE